MAVLSAGAAVKSEVMSSFQLLKRSLQMSIWLHLFLKKQLSDLK